MEKDSEIKKAVVLENKQLTQEVKNLEKTAKKLETEKNKLDIQLAKEKAKASAKASAKVFQSESKKALLTAITAAFAFILGLVWKDLITEYVNQITNLSPIQGKWIQVITITFITIIGIVVATQLLKED